MSEASFAWAAGIVDGEGSIVIEHSANSRKAHVLRVIVGNTDPRMPMRLRELFGGAVFAAKPRARERQMWTWAVSTAQAHEALLKMRPYLVCKGEQADLGLEFASTKRRPGEFRLPPGTVERRESLRQDLKILRHREAM